MRRLPILTVCLLALIGVFSLTMHPGQPVVAESPAAFVSRPQISYDAVTQAAAAQAALEVVKLDRWLTGLAEEHARQVAAAKKKSTVTRTNRGSCIRDQGVVICISTCENGGDYGRSTNPTHFGKYQYDRQTWVAHGGDPDDWGTASPEEQERVFANGTAQYGYGAWTPYDGCG